jgi:hypothetical protein
VSNRLVGKVGRDAGKGTNRPRAAVETPNREAIGLQDATRDVEHRSEHVGLMGSGFATARVLRHWSLGKF